MIQEREKTNDTGERRDPYRNVQASGWNLEHKQRDYFSSEHGQSIHRQSMPTDASECGGEDEQWYFLDCFHFLRELGSKVIIFKIG